MQFTATVPATSAATVTRPHVPAKRDDRAERAQRPLLPAAERKVNPSRSSHPMPRTIEPPEKPTPFARVLLEYMWSRRPPINANQLAIKIGLSRNTVYKWIQGIPPNLDNAILVLGKLGIPIQRLADEYQRGEHAPLAESVSTTTSRAEPTLPAQLPAATAHQADEWSALITQTITDLRAAGVDDATIGAVIDRIRSTQIDSQPLQANIAAEHSEPEVTRRAQPTKQPHPRRTVTSRPNR